MPGRATGNLFLPFAHNPAPDRWDGLGGGPLGVQAVAVFQRSLNANFHQFCNVLRPLFVGQGCFAFSGHVSPAAIGILFPPLTLDDFVGSFYFPVHSPSIQ
jgi:hypothetical protein